MNKIAKDLYHWRRDTTARMKGRETGNKWDLISNSFGMLESDIFYEKKKTGEKWIGVGEEVAA